MNTQSNITTKPLVYNGEIIHHRDDMLSLTDMWAAGGRDDAKRPSNWARKEGAYFIASLEVALNVPRGHIIKGTRGKNGETYAHWQIALAYAKYISPEFHMWCNEVVRAYMEEKPVTAAIPSEFLEMIRRTDGIARMLSHKVTVIEHAMNGVSADGLTSGEVCDLSKVATNFPRGISGRVSRRLTAFCKAHNETPRIAKLGRVRAQMFPTHLVREWLDIEGRALIAQWIAEKKGQTTFRLVGGRAA